MSVMMKRVAAMAFGLLFALVLTPFASAQDAHAAIAPSSWFVYDIRGEEAPYGAGAYITALTGDPAGEEVEGSFWDSSETVLTLPATLPGENNEAVPIVYARIPGGYAEKLDANRATELRFLNCANSEVETLLVYRLKKLEHLECSVNYLEELDLFQCVSLKHLSCGRNYLDALDVSACADLEYLDCTYNLIEDTSTLEGASTSSLSSVDPQRLSIADAAVSAQSVVYDGKSYYWDEEPVTTVTMPDGSELIPYDEGDEAGDYLLTDMVADDPADDNGNYNRAGTYTVMVTGMGDPSLGFGWGVDPYCVLIGDATGKFVIERAPLTAAMVTVPNKVYNGYIQKSVPTVKAGGLVQNKSEYATGYYAKKNGTAKVLPKNVGTYWVKVLPKNAANTKGTVWRSYKINPKATANLKLTALNNGFKASWTKRTVQVTGYQVAFKQTTASSWTIKNVASYKTNVKSYTGLKDKKTYQVKVRTYKTVNGVKHYSAWTGVKTVKTK